MQKLVATMVHEAGFLEELSRSRAIGHRDNSRYWEKVNYGLGIPAVVAATVAGTSAFSDFDQHNVVAGVLALVSAVLTALTRSWTQVRTHVCTNRPRRATGSCAASFGALGRSTSSMAVLRRS